MLLVIKKKDEWYMGVLRGRGHNNGFVVLLSEAVSLTQVITLLAGGEGTEDTQLNLGQHAHGHTTQQSL